MNSVWPQAPRKKPAIVIDSKLGSFDIDHSLIYAHDMVIDNFYIIIVIYRYN